MFLPSGIDNNAVRRQQLWDKSIAPKCDRFLSREKMINVHPISS